ncbi:hypothetical protein [Stenotrophomonas oahuensis]|uniref:Nucleotidyl transferase AbiEii/AbiGii toxin family protein n=1 Tax=Stenotrophomonas oahuensis TaxID=3003271 RepID=A0ABY9YNH0_9GAMM|nr:hypothetical protein [Stenotrophomonas sp. A5586]WNH52450.1 hypothetical protein PDM29_19360 [Stenotrophomonas sp. A5586]
MTQTVTRYAKHLLAELPEAVRRTAILAGGALRAYYDKTKLADVDLCFQNREDFDAAFVAMCSRDYTFMEWKGRSAVFKRNVDGMEFNLIGFMHGTPEDTIARFDFRCCRMAAWYDADGGLRTLFGHGAVGDAVTKTLVILVNNGTPRTVKRINHYVQDYGYTLDVSLEDHLEPDRPEALDEIQDDLYDTDGPYLSPRAFVSTVTAYRYIARLPRVAGGY